MKRVHTWARVSAFAIAVLLSSCAGQGRPGNPIKSLAGTRTTAQIPSRHAEAQCHVDAVRICQEQSHDRPSMFFPDAVKGKSAQNPSNLFAFATPFRIPGGAELKVVCYYRPNTMKVVYARAWALTDEGIMVDLDPQAGQVLNSGQPSGPALDSRSLSFLKNHGYCLGPQP